MFTVLSAQRGSYALCEPFIARIKGISKSRGLDREFLRTVTLWSLKNRAAQITVAITDCGLFEVRNTHSNGYSSQFLCLTERDQQLVHIELNLKTVRAMLAALANGRGLEDLRIHAGHDGKPSCVRTDGCIDWKPTPAPAIHDRRALEGLICGELT